LVDNVLGLSKFLDYDVHEILSPIEHVNPSSSSNPFFVGPFVNHVQEANVVKLFNFQFDSRLNPPYKK
jgi:hypothetical protein